MESARAESARARAVSTCADNEGGETRKARTANQASECPRIADHSPAAPFSATREHELRELPGCHPGRSFHQGRRLAVRVRRARDVEVGPGVFLGELSKEPRPSD